MDECAKRRKRVLDAMRARGGGVAIIRTGREVLRNRDNEYPYRSDSYFRYLSTFPEPDAAIVLVAGHGRDESILFCRPKNVERETWDGFRFGPQAGAERFGFDRGAPIDTLDQEMPALLAGQQAIWYALASKADLDRRVRQWLQAVRAQVRAGVQAPAQAIDLNRILDEMRLIKDSGEIATMRRAASISSAAHLRAMRLTRPGLREYEIEAELEYAFRRNGASGPAYGSIIASGPNACVLHYRANDAILRDGDLLLIDAACELDGYAADITRTFPVNGRFSGAQRMLYELVLEAQRQAIAAVRPGARFDDAHDVAVRVLAQGMIDCGLIAGPLQTALESGSWRRFYMHRTGHWLGIDVHDCGDYVEPDDSTGDVVNEADAGRANDGADAGAHAGADAGTQAGARSGAKRSRILRAGMITTIEPGIYIRAGDDIPDEFHDIGIRIEDDILVTSAGCEVLTAESPKSIDDIENLMRADAPGLFR